MSEFLYLGVGGHAVCLHKETGDDRWQRKPRGGATTNILCDGAHLFVYSRGHAFCLEIADGRIVWENSLTGLGYSYCIMADGNQSPQGGVLSAAAAEAQAAAASSSAG